MEREIGSRRPAFFLDYDGTLTPIVPRPEDAVLGESMRTVLRELADRHPVAIVSGRGRPDVRERIGVEGLWYAGSHGFDISGPDAEITWEGAASVVPTVREVTTRLQFDLAGIEGAQVEPKRFTVAVHYRRVADRDLSRAEAIVDRAVGEHPELRKAGGKKVWEIRPDFDWDKGRAVEWLLESLGLDGEEIVPIYVGDDETDEDAFRALAGRNPPGIGLLVSEEPRPTAARYRLRDPDDVREWLAGWARGD